MYKLTRSPVGARRSARRIVPVTMTSEPIVAMGGGRNDTDTATGGGAAARTTMEPFPPTSVATATSRASTN